MLKLSRGLKISGAALLFGALAAAPAQAQIGGVTGSVGGNLGGAVSSSSTIGSEIRTPAPKARVSVTSRSSSRSSGTHYHGGYAHDHGGYRSDHYHDDPYSHSHGYADVTVHVKSGSNKQAVGPMLTRGQQVYSRKGKDLGYITSLTRKKSGKVTEVYVDGVPKPIPVDTLSAEGDILRTSLKKKKLT